MDGEKLIRASDARKAILNIDPRIAYCIDSVPAVDAVELVRCKKCKFWFKNNGHNKPGCPIVDADIWMDDDSFCSYGERKDGE